MGLGRSAREEQRRALAARVTEGRLQAAVLLVMPPAMFMLIILLNRNYGQILLDHAGLLVGVFVMEFLGWLWIRKIVNFDF